MFWDAGHVYTSYFNFLNDTYQLLLVYPKNSISAFELNKNNNTWFNISVNIYLYFHMNHVCTFALFRFSLLFIWGLNLLGYAQKWS